MKNIFSLLFVVMGLFLVGVGTFIGFETYDYKYNKTVFSKNNNELSMYNGIYFASSDLIQVKDQGNDTLMLQINGEEYDFSRDGQFFVNEESGFSVEFKDEKLILYKDGNLIKTLIKKYKNSIPE